MTFLSDEELHALDCANCGKRPADTNWTGDSAALGWIHGDSEPWCAICALSARITFAKKHPENTIEAMELELLGLYGKEKA